MPRMAKHRIKFKGMYRPEMGYYPRAKGIGKVKKKINEAIRICKECGMVSVGKRWFHGLLETKHLDMLIERTYCPGCEAVLKKHIEGLVELRTNLLKRSKFEVLGLLHHIEESAMRDNPFNRIINIEWPKADIIRVTTTSTFLAKIIGKKFHRAYKGKLEMKFAHNDPFVNVIWTDDDYTGKAAQRGRVRTKPKSKRRLVSSKSRIRKAKAEKIKSPIKVKVRAR